MVAAGNLRDHAEFGEFSILSDVYDGHAKHLTFFVATACGNENAGL